MRKGELGTQQIMHMFELIITVIVILIFFTSVQGSDPSQFKDIDHSLSANALAYGDQLFTNSQLVEDPLEPFSGQKRSLT